MILGDNSIQTIAPEAFVALMDNLLAEKAGIQLLAKRVKNQIPAAGSSEIEGVDLGVFA